MSGLQGLIGYKGCCCDVEPPVPSCCGDIQPKEEANVGFPSNIGVTSEYDPPGGYIPGTMCGASAQLSEYEWTAESCWGGGYWRGRSSITDAYGYREVAIWNCYDHNSFYENFNEGGYLARSTTEIAGDCCDICFAADPPEACPPCSDGYTAFSGNVTVPIDDDPTPYCLDAFLCKFPPSESHFGNLVIQYEVIDITDFPDTSHGVSKVTAFTVSRDALADSIDYCAPDQAPCVNKYIDWFVAARGEICSNTELAELVSPCTNPCTCTPGGTNCKCSSGFIQLTIRERGARISSRQLVKGQLYAIVTSGTANWRCYGALNNNVGTLFTATECNSGCGSLCGDDPADCAIICDPFAGVARYGNAIPIYLQVFRLYGRGSSYSITQKFRNNLANGTYSYVSDTTWDGVTNVSVAANALVVGESYQIQTVGTTDFTAVGAPENVVGWCFTATAATTGTGTASLNGARRIDQLITGYTIEDENDVWFGGTQFVPAAPTWSPLHSDPNEPQVSQCPCDAICVDRLYNIWNFFPTLGIATEPIVVEAIPAHYARLISEATYTNNTILFDYPPPIGLGELCIDADAEQGTGIPDCVSSVISDYCPIEPGTNGPAMISFWNSTLTITGTCMSWGIFEGG